MLTGKRLLLVIGGGIAAYKTLYLIRRLKEQGASVRAILTRAGAQFVTPLSVAGLTEEKVYTDLFSLTDEAEMGHIQLSRQADLVIVAPATADLLAKMANGLADDLASTALMATDKPVLVAPAMNVRMWLHPATRRNVDGLVSDGIGFVGPNNGDMACGEFGPGRMAEPEDIIEAIERHFAGPADTPLKGRRVLVTAGPTHEPIDPVRYIANLSSGRQGYAIAEAARALGAETILVTGPVTLEPPQGVIVRRVDTAQAMLKACEESLPVDIGIFTAAVADWRVANAASQKIKKQAGRPATLTLTENPDILRAIAKHSESRPELVVGFAAETENVLENAQSKRESKGCDWVVANDVSPATGIMGGTANSIHLITEDGTEHWPAMPKQEVANRLMERIASYFKTTGAKATTS